MNIEFEAKIVHNGRKQTVKIVIPRRRFVQIFNQLWNAKKGQCCSTEPKPEPEVPVAEVPPSEGNLVTLADPQTSTSTGESLPVMAEKPAKKKGMGKKKGFGKRAKLGKIFS